MSKIAFYADLDRVLPDGGSELFVCSSEDRQRYADRVGEPVLIANTGSVLASGFVALGTLGAFQIDSFGRSQAQVDAVRAFPAEVPIFDAFPENGQIKEVSDEYFGAVIEQATGSHDLGEMPMLSLGLAPQDRFSTELALLYRNRCSFSDVRTYNGAACMIRPLDQGGSWDISNFLFLDPEPAALFARFAWTVGPKFQIIVDADAVSADISDTVNRTGVLSLPENTANWPDRSALAWHFEQFTKRLTGGA